MSECSHDRYVVDVYDYCPDCGEVNPSVYHRYEQRIALLSARCASLEAVAEAAEVYCHLNGEGTCDELAAYYAASDKLDDALRAAGYLKDGPS